MELNRRDRILKNIVELFIKTAQPVSSQALIECYSLDYSSATIRAEMNLLEKSGLIEKTHTSSGRVPSSLGYKYYVDNLRSKGVDEEIRFRLQAVLDQKMQTVEQVMNKAGEILANMTDLVSVILGPKASSEHLVSLQLIPISKNSVTAIFVTDRGCVENKTFLLSDDISVDDLKDSMTIIGDRLKGSRIDELIAKLINLKPVLTDYIVEHEIIYQALIEAVSKFQEERLSYFNEEKIYQLPYLKNNSKKIEQTLFELDKEDEELLIKIGGENEDITIVRAKIQGDGEDDGVIALIGPKRMDYEKAVNSLEFILNELKAKKKEGGR